MTADFATPAWVDLARRELTDIVHSLGDTVAGIRFSACEVFTNPPPELVPDGADRLAWHLTIDGSAVAVEAGERAGCDHAVEVDYHVALPIARMVYTPEVLTEAAARRTAAVARGKPDHAPPVPAALEQAMIEFHNRMATHTR